jgi:SAM-dependent methyltransferase
MDWYELVYGACYRLGFTPWDRGAPASGLVGLVDGPEALKPGRALDLGCGTGTNTIFLCSNGWQVTGVDIVPRALEAARRNARHARVSPSFVGGDVTRLRELDLEGAFDLVVDVGCFHTLPAGLRERYVESVSSVATPGATLFLFAFSPRRLAPVRSGVTHEEIVASFQGWRLISGNPSLDGTTAASWRGAAARYFAPHEYTLRREP